MAKTKPSELTTFEKAETVMMLINCNAGQRVEDLLSTKHQQLYSGKQIHMIVLHHQNKIKPYSIIDKHIHLTNLIPKDFNWLGWPRSSINHKLSDLKADLVMSFDADRDLRLLFASTKTESGFRVELGNADPKSNFDLTLSSESLANLDEIFLQQCNYLKRLNGENNV